MDEKRKWNELISKKHKKNLKDFKLYWAFIFFLASTVIRCISISTFASLLGIPVGIAS